MRHALYVNSDVHTIRRSSSPESTMSVGKALLRVRQERALTQSQVSERAGLATSYVSRIENNRVQPTMRTVQRLAQALGVPLSTLFRLEERAGAATIHECPVSSSGECIGELIRNQHGRKPDLRYGVEELRLLRMTDFLVRSASKDVRKALAVLLEALVDQARRESR
jgi:transcriptional regulator with XRE-family HTH domain